MEFKDRRGPKGCTESIGIVYNYFNPRMKSLESPRNIQASSSAPKWSLQSRHFRSGHYQILRAQRLKQRQPKKEIWERRVDAYIKAETTVDSHHRRYSPQSIDDTHTTYRQSLNPFLTMQPLLATAIGLLEMDLLRTRVTKLNVASNNHREDFLLEHIQDKNWRNPTRQYSPGNTSSYTARDYRQANSLPATGHDAKTIDKSLASK